VTKFFKTTVIFSAFENKKGVKC